MSQSHGDRFAHSRPLTKEEKKQRQDLLKDSNLFFIQILAAGFICLKEKPRFVQMGKKAMFIGALRPYSIEE